MGCFQLPKNGDGLMFTGHILTLYLSKTDSYGIPVLSLSLPEHETYDLWTWGGEAPMSIPAFKFLGEII